MSRHYAGLIIGGPMAGQSIAMAAPTLEVEQQTPARWKPNATKPTQGITTERYTWMEIAGLGLWVLEGTTPMEAMNELAMGYMGSLK